MVFIPVHDGKPLIHISRPYVTWSIIGLNALIFLLLQHGGLEDASQGSVVSFGLIPAVFNDLRVLPPDFVDIPDAFNLITYAFLHGDLWHLAGNMVFLWVFADNVEDCMGHVRFLIFYCLCAIAGGYAYVLFDPSSEAPLVGASGAIAGVVAAYFMLHPFQKIWVLVFARIPIRLNALWVLGFWILFQFYSIAVATPDDEVAWSMHIGGLVTGAILVLFLRRRGVPLFDRGVQVIAVPPLPPSVDERETRR